MTLQQTFPSPFPPSLLSGVDFNYNNSVAETVLATLTPIPAYAQGQGFFAWFLCYTQNGTAGTPTTTFRARRTGLGGTVLWTAASTMLASVNEEVDIDWRLLRSIPAFGDFYSLRINRHQRGFLLASTPSFLDVSVSLDLSGQTVVLTAQMDQALGTIVTGIRGYALLPLLR